MTIYVKGKDHLAGDSKKTGKPFDIILIYADVPFPEIAKNSVGVKGKEVILPANRFHYDDIKVNQNYELYYSENGSVDVFKPTNQKV